MSLPPTNAEIAYQQSGLLDRWTLYTTQLRDWLGGTATGGPNGDGTYPLQDSTGLTFYVPCAAAWQAKVDAITDPLTGLQATVDQSVADAQAAETAAQTSETNAAASATAAQSASSDASMYATNSANSAADSLTYKNAAATSETNAANSATAAATSETNAANSATAAANSATDADNDAVAADQSAQDAAASAQQAATYAAGRLTYIGSWDVSGGTLPAIGNKGDFYAITGTATINGVEYANGDMAVSDGSTGFDKIDNTDKVTSVAGLIGTISTAQLQTALNLGTAAYQPTTAFATAAQGTAADNAMPKAGGAFTGSVDCNGVFRATGSAPVPATGVGVEVQYSAANGSGYVISYDRGAGGYKPLSIRGSTVGIGVGGSPDEIVLDSNGLTMSVPLTTTGPPQIVDDGVDTAIRFIGTDGTTLKGIIGVASANGRIELDSAAGDLCIRAMAGSNLRFTDPAGHFLGGFRLSDRTFWRPGTTTNSSIRQPVIFVQSTDPGSLAADGDLWIW